jgi:hypothetical protein
MSARTVEQEKRIRQIVTPEPPRFDEHERRLYSHDTGVLPALARPLAGASLADGTFSLPKVPATFGDRDPALGPAKVTFHDPCHIGRDGGVCEPPRHLIRAIPGVELVEMAHHHEDALCCGSVLTRIGEPAPTSDTLGSKRIGEAKAIDADALLAAEGLGVKDLPAPNPEVLRQRAMFEKFIAMMTVDGMVQVMGALTPRLLDAMPLGMGAMMRLIGRAPAALREPAFIAMRPLMPVLFLVNTA